MTASQPLSSGRKAVIVTMIVLVHKVSCQSKPDSLFFQKKKENVICIEPLLIRGSLVLYVGDDTCGYLVSSHTLLLHCVCCIHTVASRFHCPISESSSMMYKKTFHSTLCFVLLLALEHERDLLCLLHSPPSFAVQGLPYTTDGP